MTTRSTNLPDSLAEQAAPPLQRVDLRRSNSMRMGSFAFCGLFFALFGLAAAFDLVNPRAAALLACAAGAMIAFADALYIRQMDHTIALMADALADSGRDVNDLSSEFVLPESSPVKAISKLIAERDGRVRDMVFRVRRGTLGAACHTAHLTRSLRDTAGLAQSQRALAEQVFAASETSRSAVDSARQHANDLDEATRRGAGRGLKGKLRAGFRFRPDAANSVDMHPPAACRIRRRPAAPSERCRRIAP